MNYLWIFMQRFEIIPRRRMPVRDKTCQPADRYALLFIIRRRMIIHSYGMTYDHQDHSSVVIDFINQNCRYKSAGIQIPHDASWAMIPNPVRKFLVHCDHTTSDPVVLEQQFEI